MKRLRGVALSFRGKLILSYVLLIALPLVVLGVFSYQSVLGLVLEQRITHHRTSLEQLANYENSVMDQYVRSLRAIATNRQLASILRRVSLQQPTRGAEYDIYQEIHGILHPLTVQEGSLSVKLALRGRANFIAPYFDFFPLGQLTDTAAYEQHLSQQAVDPVLFPSSMAAAIYPVRSDSFFLATRLVNWDSNNDTLGYLLVEVDADVLLRPLRQFDIPDRSRLTLTSGDLVVFQGVGADGLSGRANATAGRTEFRADITGIGGELLLSMPSVQPSAGGAELAALQLVTAAVLSLGAVAFAMYLAGSLNRGMQGAMRTIKTIENGQIQAVEGSTRRDEFGELQNALSRMAGQIRTLIREAVTAERKHKQMEFRLLYEQINPHFIYNTLDVVYWEALSAGEDKLAELTRTLTDYLRLSLNHGHELIRLGNELEEVAKYIHIINYCYHDCVTLTIHAPEDVLDLKVINTILQPLVENAVFHGILAKDERRGRIDIEVSLQDDFLTITIADDGAGMAEKGIDGFLRSDSAHSGLRNVNNRIQAYYGMRSGIRHDPDHSPGCLVRIVLDLSAAEDIRWEEPAFPYPPATAKEE